MKNENILFLSGDYEAQKLLKDPIANMPYFLKKHFIYSILLVPKVIMPSGCYYESEHTQSIIHKYKELYLPYGNSPAQAELSIGDDRGSFAEDIKIKKDWFPKGYVVTDDTKNESLTKEISSIQPGIRTGKMRKRLADNIANDISENSLVRKTLEKLLDTKEQSKELLKPLQNIIEKQDFAMLPPYIDIEMERHGLSASSGQKRWLEFVLFINYAKSCEVAYESYCNNPLSIHYHSVFRKLYPYHLDYRDTNLFECFLEMFPLPELKQIEELDYIQILEIKKSDKFKLYKDCYKALVEWLKNKFREIIFDFHPDYDEFKINFKNHKIDELKQLKSTLNSNIQEVTVLYKTLKKPLFKIENFRKWIELNINEMPTVQILSCLDNQFLNAYIHELFIASDIIRKEINMMNNSKKMSVIGFSNNNINQKIDSENLGIKTYKKLDVCKNEFQSIRQDNLEIFLCELNKETNLEIINAKKAFLEVMNAKYSATEEECQSYLSKWKTEKDNFSNNAKEVLTVAAQVAGILSFILKLLGL